MPFSIKYKIVEGAERCGRTQVEYTFVEDSLVTKARALNEGLGRLDPLVQALLVGLLKLHSACNAVDDRLTARFVAASGSSFSPVKPFSPGDSSVITAQSMAITGSLHTFPIS